MISSMNCKVYTIPTFDKQAKRLAKKYPSFKSDLTVLVNKLAENPKQGKAIGNGFYKIRLAITSKAKGKSGGARVITYLRLTQNAVYRTNVFDKSELNSRSVHELQAIFKSTSSETH